MTRSPLYLNLCRFSPSSQVLSTRKPFFNQYHYNKISIGPRDVENVKLDETSLMVMIDTKYRQLDNVLLKFQTMVSHFYESLRHWYK